MKSSLIFLSGMAVGIVTGIFIAPEPGRVTLRKVKEEADKIIDNVLQKDGLNRETRQSEEPIVNAG